MFTVHILQTAYFIIFEHKMGCSALQNRQGMNKHPLLSEAAPELYNPIQAPKFRIKRLAGNFGTEYYGNVL